MSKALLQHEALDRLHVVCSTIGDHIVGHPGVTENEEAHEKVELALSLLGNAYQCISRKCEHLS